MDSNVYYSFFHSPFGDAGKVMLEALKENIELYSPDMVYEEMRRLLTNDFGLSNEKAIQSLDVLPVRWIDKDIYTDFMEKAKIIQHPSDRPVLALALSLGCGILTFDKHFRPARKLVTLWRIRDLIAAAHD